MTTKIIVTFFLLVLSTWVTKPEEMKGKKANFQVNNKTFWKSEVNAIRKSVKVLQLVIKINRLAEHVSSLNIFSGACDPYICLFFLNTFINTFQKICSCFRVQHSNQDQNLFSILLIVPLHMIIRWEFTPSH